MLCTCMVAELSFCGPQSGQLSDHKQFHVLAELQDMSALA